MGGRPGGRGGVGASGWPWVDGGVPPRAVCWCSAVWAGASGPKWVLICCGTLDAAVDRLNSECGEPCRAGGDDATKSARVSAGGDDRGVDPERRSAGAGEDADALLTF